MFQFFSRRLHDERGFTLIELLSVVATIAILAAILIPNFLRARAQSQFSATKGNMKNTTTELESYFVDNSTYPTTLAQMQPNYIRAIPNDACAGAGVAFTYAITGTAPYTDYTLYTSWTAAMVCSGTLGSNGLSYTPAGGLVAY